MVRVCILSSRMRALDLLPASKACALCPLSSLSCYSFYEKLACVSWSECIQQLAVFWGGSPRLIFPLFWRVAETSKRSSQGGSSEIRQRGISQALWENLIAETFLHCVSLKGRLSLGPVVYFLSWKQLLSSFALSQPNQHWSVSPSGRVLTSWEAQSLYSPNPTGSH